MPATPAQRPPPADHPAPFVKTSAENHEIAAGHYAEAAKAYHLAAAHFDYGDYQQANDHASSGKNHIRQGDRHCVLAAQWP